MKKFFLSFVALFFTIGLFAGEATLNKTTLELATQYGWKTETCYLNFDLNSDIYVVVAKDGNGKYLDNSATGGTDKNIRFYQSHESFSIKSRNGSKIKSVTLNYGVINNGVLTTVWKDGGKKVAAADQIKSDAVYTVDSTEVTFYTGNTGDATNGQIRVNSWKVVYEESKLTASETKTTAALAAQYGWQSDSCYLDFELNGDVAVKVERDGNCKYLDNSATGGTDNNLRFYQWKGGFKIAATSSVKIKSIMITYTSVNKGVLTKVWKNGGRKVAAANQIKSDVTYDVNDREITLYTGNTENATDGQVRIKSWTVTYTYPRVYMALERTSAAMAVQNKWKHDSCYLNFALNADLTVHVDSSGTSKYLCNGPDNNMRYYQWKGPLTIRADKGAFIKAIRLNYGSMNNGVLTSVWQNGGKSVARENMILSDVLYTVNSDSVTLYVGNEKANTNGQVRINKWLIIYEDSTAIHETFSQCTAVGGETPDTTAFAGDLGLNNWIFTNFQRGEDVLVGDYQGTRLNDEGSIATDSVIEGGVKDIEFTWSAVNDQLPKHYTVTVGDSICTYQLDSAVAQKGYVYTFSQASERKQNSAIAIQMGAKEAGNGQSPVVVGPVKITPYLLFAVQGRRDTIYSEQLPYNFNKVLINNTGAPAEFTVTSNTTGGKDSISNGWLYAKDMTRNGELVVKASWNEGKVTTTMTLYVYRQAAVSFDSDTVRVDLFDNSFVNKFTLPQGAGAVTYLSSDTNVVVVAADGTVTPVGLGTAFVQAQVASSELYGAASASYVVIVSYTPVEGEYFVESFSNCEATTAYTERVHVKGDYQVYDWTIARFQRDVTDSVGDAPGVQLRYNGSIASTNALDGGIKRMAFCWRYAEEDKPINFTICVGGDTTVYSHEPMYGNTIMQYVRAYNSPCSTPVSISVGEKANPEQTYVIVGPLVITPYLLFYTRRDTLDMIFATSLDLHDRLIDNTYNATAITYTITADETGAAKLNGSVLDVSAVTKSGEVDVTATWNKVTTSIRLWVEVAPETGLIDHFADSPTHQLTKIIKDNQLIILRNGKSYSVLGTPTNL